MQIEQIAQNLYKKHQGRYTIYEMEGREVEFMYKGEKIKCKLSSVRRDVFGNRIFFTGDNGHTYDFREPSYISQGADGSIIFNYVNSVEKTFVDENAENAPVETSETIFRML